MRFTSDYQPENRGRKPGSRNKANQLIAEAAPEIVQKVIDQALAGDTAAQNLLLARAVPALKAVAPPLALEGSPTDFAELANQIIKALMQGADPQSTHQALGALVNASKVHELFAFEARIKALEDGVEGP